MGGLGTNPLFFLRKGQKLLKCGLAAECSTFIHSFLLQKNYASAGVTLAVLN